MIGRLDISSLHRRALAEYTVSQEANGIAWDSNEGLLFITGKLWPKGYVLKVNP